MEELMGVTELSQYLKVNPQTIYNWVSNSKVPYTKVGDLLRFKKSDIDVWLKKKTAYPDRVRYEDFEIEASPYQLADSKKWTININIWKFSSDGAKCTPYSAKNTYDTKEEAMKNCFIFGKKIIDGEITNFKTYIEE
ncbi:MAG: helix-turn-helix domain-containing protein [Candidatus Zapsychrus exili]|nr:helix-turn-helix domain-containing protein [Candidatus Zapsychrus exili]